MINKCRYAECHYAECRYAEFHAALYSTVSKGKTTFQKSFQQLLREFKKY